MSIRNLLSLSLLLAATVGFAQDSAQSELKLDLLPNEAWWGGAVTLGTKMPYGVAPIDINLDGDNRGNQYAPLLVSSKGRYVWCHKAFRFAFKDKTLCVTSAGNTFRYGQAGQNLRDAYRHAAKSFFPTDGKLPDRALFATPQYNTWIELMYDQNQRDVLKYAHAIVDNSLPPGVLMIDDNWQEDYGKWTFHPGRFPDPKAMMNELHALGFKVMVWVCPFVSPDCDVYRALAKKKAFFMDQPGDPAMAKWWNGKSAMLDLSNPAAKTWFNRVERSRLEAVVRVANGTNVQTSRNAASDAPAGSSCGELICFTDMLATVASLLGGKLPDDAGEDSFDISPLLRGEKPARPIRNAMVHVNYGSYTLAIRAGDWKLILPSRVYAVQDGTVTPDHIVETTGKGPNDKFQLYNLRTDPGEATNVFTQEPEKAEELFAALKADIARGTSR